MFIDNIELKCPSQTQVMQLVKCDLGLFNLPNQVLLTFNHSSIPAINLNIINTFSQFFINFTQPGYYEVKALEAVLNTYSSKMIQVFASNFDAEFSCLVIDLNQFLFIQLRFNDSASVWRRNRTNNQELQWKIPPIQIILFDWWSEFYESTW